MVRMGCPLQGVVSFHGVLQSDLVNILQVRGQCAQRVGGESGRSSELAPSCLILPHGLNFQTDSTAGRVQLPDFDDKVNMEGVQPDNHTKGCKVLIENAEVRKQLICPFLSFLELARQTPYCTRKLTN